MCSEEDLKSIGLPLGPRKKILKFVKEKEQKEAAISEGEVLNVPPTVAAPVTGLEATQSQHSW